MNIKIETIGRIISGDETGFFVKILDDSENTGGFIILTSPSKEFNNTVYDNWVEKFDYLEEYFNESSWVIDWLEE